MQFTKTKYYNGALLSLIIGLFPLTSVTASQGLIAYSEL